MKLKANIFRKIPINLKYQFLIIIIIKLILKINCQEKQKKKVSYRNTCGFLGTYVDRTYTRIASFTVKVSIEPASHLFLNHLLSGHIYTLTKWSKEVQKIDLIAKFKKSITNKLHLKKLKITSSSYHIL